MHYGVIFVALETGELQSEGLWEIDYSQNPRHWQCSVSSYKRCFSCFKATGERDYSLVVAVLQRPGGHV